MKVKLLVTLLCFCLFSIYTFEVEAQTKRGRTPRNSSAAPRSSSAAITTPSGLTYLITKKGTGRPLKAGDTVILNYTGTLTNGVKFDSSHDRQQPFAFKLGAAQVIKGWDEGVAKLHVGDHAILMIPGKLAYGPKGVPGVIPPDSTLIFIVEVVDVKETSLSDALSKTGFARKVRVRENL
jgi:peptidylprolyl isomerase